MPPDPDPTDAQLTAMAFEGAFRDVFGPLVGDDDAPTLPDLIAAYDAQPDSTAATRLAWAIGQAGGAVVVVGGRVYATDSAGHLIVRRVRWGDQEGPQEPRHAIGDTGCVVQVTEASGRVLRHPGRNEAAS